MVVAGVVAVVGVAVVVAVAAVVVPGALMKTHVRAPCGMAFWHSLNLLVHLLRWGNPDCNRKRQEIKLSSKTET